MFKVDPTGIQFGLELIFKRILITQYIYMEVLGRGGGQCIPLYLIRADLTIEHGAGEGCASGLPTLPRPQQLPTTNSHIK